MHKFMSNVIASLSYNLMHNCLCVVSDTWRLHDPAIRQLGMGVSVTCLSHIFIMPHRLPEIVNL